MKNALCEYLPLWWYLKKNLCPRRCCSFSLCMLLSFIYMILICHKRPQMMTILPEWWQGWIPVVLPFCPPSILDSVLWPNNWSARCRKKYVIHSHTTNQIRDLLDCYCLIFIIVCLAFVNPQPHLREKLLGSGNRTCQLWQADEALTSSLVCWGLTEIDRQSEEIKYYFSNPC